MLYTARFQNKQIKRAGRAAVAISLGVPKWPLGYSIAAQVRDLAPDGWALHIKDEAEYRRKYEAKLERLGVDRVRDQLEQISQMHGNADLVLLCWEDIARPGVWCHRRMFADWWERKTGQRVDELPEPERLQPALLLYRQLHLL